MEINAELINEAEEFLLPDDCHFDDERREFILSLDSRDLVAVPGSGKTTALQAKLYCLSKSLPFDNGAGILVLSHTNAAVEEIKSRLAFTAPQLFSYPCAVVTVQEFVDRFLALPYYTAKYKSSIVAIDETRYYEAVKRYMFGFNRHDYARIIWDNVQQDSNPYLKARFFYDVEHDRTLLSSSPQFNELKVCLPPSWIRDREERISHVKDIIFGMKTTIMEDGILTYDDCYYLASEYIAKHPNVINYLRKRFPIVFVDETQDLKKYQLDIISRIFNDPSIVLQRVGDHNQAIFTSGREGDCEWLPQNPRMLKKSLRLSDTIANIVNPFMLSRTTEVGEEEYSVVGAQQNPQNIRPCLMLYDMEHKERIKDRFKELICEYNLQDNSDAKYGFHVIGWNASYSIKAADEERPKPRMEEIFPEYRHHSTARMNSRASLSDYINLIQLPATSKEIKDEIMAAICHAISIAGGFQTINVAGVQIRRHYSPTSFAAKAKENPDSGNEYEGVLYRAVSCLSKHDLDGAYTLIKGYISGGVLRLLGLRSNQALQSFLGDNFQKANNDIVEDIEAADSIPIDISTVHSAKGQTHCATLYVETSFKGKFESEWLITKKKATKTIPERLNASPFFGDCVVPTTDAGKHSMKMIYVGFSRPRQLLCYASWKSLWTDEMLRKMDERGWRIIDTTKDN